MSIECLCRKQEGVKGDEATFADQLDRTDRIGVNGAHNQVFTEEINAESPAEVKHECAVDSDEFQPYCVMNGYETSYTCSQLPNNDAQEAETSYL